MRKFKSCCQIAALLTVSLFVPKLATFADMPTVKEQDTSNIIAQTSATRANPAIDKKADQILRQMSDFLESQEKFSFSVETERDLLTTTGVFIQVAHEGDIIVNRPNQFWANSTGELIQREFWYDGSKVTVVDPERNLYATGDAPASMDETLDTLVQKLNVDMPLADLLYSDLYEGLTKNVQAGFYYGMVEVDDVPCHHLVFVQDSIDWQVWIEDSETPLLRKVAIAYKNREGVPRYTATLSNWNLEPTIAPDQFTFSPPANARKVDFVQATPY
ncbi:MAG: DUF2092 domain-containing protein [Xenococcaceae cyanobacterium MO_234.B1]|nr:DUF2092 domain-containing protein [Xenococcaceae cyanobacterium MO_234.B1]